MARRTYYGFNAASSFHELDVYQRPRFRLALDNINAGDFTADLSTLFSQDRHQTCALINVVMRRYGNVRNERYVGPQMRLEQAAVQPVMQVSDSGRAMIGHQEDMSAFPDGALDRSRLCKDERELLKVG
jgi:hypothetical protein